MQHVGERKRQLFNTGIETFISFYAAGVVCHPAPGWVAEDVCHDGLRRLSAVWSENFDEIELEICDLRDLHTRLLVLAELTGHARNSGALIRRPFAAVNADLRADGKVGDVRFYLDWREALDAVGSAASATQPPHERPLLGIRAA